MQQSSEIIRKLREVEPCFGTWLSLGSSIVAELAQKCGFDWMVIDLEHGYSTMSSIIPVLQATNYGGPSIIVRVPTIDPATIGLLLDWGAAGIMLSRVTKASEATACLSAMQFPPDGMRGYSSSARVFNFGLGTPESSQKKKAPVFLAQIETVEGVKNAPEIAAVPGTDALFVGPTDLRLSLESEGLGDEQEFEKAVDSVISAASNALIASGILIRGKDQIEKTLKRGFTCIAVSSDMRIMRLEFEAITQTIRKIETQHRISVSN